MGNFTVSLFYDFVVVYTITLDSGGVGTAGVFAGLAFLASPVGFGVELKPLFIRHFLGPPKRFLFFFLKGFYLKNLSLCIVGGWFLGVLMG